MSQDNTPRDPQPATVTSLPAPEPPVSLSDLRLYRNRELSWLEFNQRVLDEACDPTVPMLERLKFLCIVSSNLDEFFMVRVAGIKQQQTGGVQDRAPDGLSPVEVLHDVSRRVHEMIGAQYRVLSGDIIPKLRELGVQLVHRSELSDQDRAFLMRFFRAEVFPVLTPLVVDQGHPFPRLGNRSLNLALFVSDNEFPNEDPVFAVVQVPSVLPRLVELPHGTDGAGVTMKKRYMLLEDVVALHVDQLFAGNTVIACHAFRITRNGDLSIDEEEAADLLKTIQKELRRRERGSAVRLEVAQEMPPNIVDTLKQAFRLDADDVYRTDGPFHLPDLMPIYGLEGFDAQHDEPHVPVVATAFRDETVSVFDVIKKGDVLLHHPYESFQSVIDFIEEAADDPHVLAIKQTLYRTSPDSPIVRALMRGADNGKQVTALVELKARFDESSNIRWAAQLEESGVHVVYGLVGLKTHAKIALVVRREPAGIMRYVHLSTGNYNPKTANLYTDVSLFTARQEFGEDASNVFNMLTGYCEPPAFHKLIVAPLQMRRWVIGKIAAEEQAGSKGRIFAQMNSLVDAKVIEALYAASRAGAKIELFVRGICCLKPGVPGVSENIRVFSVVDRFLEHRRMFNFEAGGKNEVYLGSADWMERNLNRRVEVLYPVDDPTLKARILDEIFQTMRLDNVKSRELSADGTYVRPVVAEGDHLWRSQKKFVDIARGNKDALQGIPLSDRRSNPFQPIYKVTPSV
ncbi:MAG: polyphosphate kinase 1 [Deltaproteobacteria bacterium]|nr:polyphosphate kinase 1 [Deltaproteobacteria bacterium]